MVVLYFNYIEMDSWPRRKKNKMSNYCVWRFVELSKECLMCQCRWWLLSCIYLAPVLINELYVSQGIDTVWPWMRDDILFSLIWHISAVFPKCVLQEPKSFNTCTQTYIGTFFLKARQIMDPQNEGRNKPLRPLYASLQSCSRCLARAAKLDDRQARKERKYMDMPQSPRY